MSNRALVFMFNSIEELDTPQITSLVAKICAMTGCKMENVEVKQLNSNDITNCIISTVHPVVKKDEPISPEVKAEPIFPGVAALVYIAGKFANDLVGENRNALRFSSNFATYVTMAKVTGTDYEMLRALDIVRGCEAKDFTRAFKLKTGITDTIFGIIKQIAINVQDLTC